MSQESHATEAQASQPNAGENSTNSGGDVHPDGRNPSSNMKSYALLTPDIKKAYMS